MTGTSKSTIFATVPTSLSVWGRSGNHPRYSESECLASIVRSVGAARVSKVYYYDLLPPYVVSAADVSHSLGGVGCSPNERLGPDKDDLMIWRQAFIHFALEHLKLPQTADQYRDAFLRFAEESRLDPGAESASFLHRNVKRVGSELFRIASEVPPGESALVIMPAPHLMFATRIAQHGGPRCRTFLCGDVMELTYEFHGEMGARVLSKISAQRLTGSLHQNLALAAE